MTNPQNPSQNPNPNSGNGDPIPSGGFGGSHNDENQTAVWNNNAGNGMSGNAPQYGGQQTRQPQQYGAQQNQQYGAQQYGAQPWQPNQQPQFGQPGQGMIQQPKKRHLGLKIFISLLIVIILLLLLAEFGVRWFMKDQIKAGFKDQMQESGISTSEDPKVSFGASPLLLGLVQQKIPQMTVDIPSTLDISYEGQDKSKPIVKGEPAVHLELRDLKFDSQDANKSTAGELKGHTTIPKEMLLAQANESSEDDKSNDPVSGMMQLTDVKPNPDKQTLTFEITGGLAAFEVKPTVQDGKMKMEMDSFSLLGFELPESFTSQLESQLEDSVPTDLQDGMKFESINVTDAGMEIHLYGQDISLNELESDTTTNGGNSDSGSGDSGKNTDVTRPWKNDGPVGSSALAA